MSQACQLVIYALRMAGRTLSSAALPVACRSTAAIRALIFLLRSDMPCGKEQLKVRSLSRRFEHLSPIRTKPITLSHLLRMLYTAAVIASRRSGHRQPHAIKITLPEALSEEPLLCTGLPEVLADRYLSGT